MLSSTLVKGASRTSKQEYEELLARRRHLLANLSNARFIIANAELDQLDDLKEQLAVVQKQLRSLRRKTSASWKAHLEQQLEDFWAVHFGWSPGPFTNKSAGCAIIFKSAKFKKNPGALGRGGLVRLKAHHYDIVVAEKEVTDRDCGPRCSQCGGDLPCRCMMLHSLLSGGGEYPCILVQSSPEWEVPATPDHQKDSAGQ